ncbi:MAG: hypothetical protein ARM1_0769 [Candidatus Micrarchaeota archaeon]|nr:MAG: hypothetical protein ARM1_0769 [Candidatus Micrarchaeota archaeon]
MFERLVAGWRIASKIRKEIFKDKKLLLYPIASAIVVILEFILIVASFFIVSISQAPTQAGVSPLVYIVLLFIFYVISSFTSAYFLMAFYIAFDEHLKGNNISLSEALSKAKDYGSVLLKWSLFYSTVILIIRIIESRLRGISRIILGLAAGMALWAGLIFAFPIIYEKKLDPISAVKESAETLVKAFGSTISGIAYSDLYGIGMMLIGFLVLITSAIASGLLNSSIFLAIGLILFSVFIILGAIVSSTTFNAFRLLLYKYVSSGQLPAILDEDTIKQAIRYKKR